MSSKFPIDPQQNCLHQLPFGNLLLVFLLRTHFFHGKHICCEVGNTLRTYGEKRSGVHMK